MKRCLFFTLFVLTLSQLAAQTPTCTPDRSFRDAESGVYPAPSDIPFAEVCVGDYFETTLTAVLQDSVTAFGVTVAVDAFVIDEVEGLPDGIEFSCTPSCSIVNDSISCMLIYGIPDGTVAPGDYELFVKGQAFVGQTQLPITFPDENVEGSFILRVNNCGDSNCTTLLSKEVDAPSCFEECDGSATITATGGNEPYSYQWNAATNNQTTARARNLCAGTYQVTVTDAIGCQSISTMIVPSVPSFSAEITQQQNIGCTNSTGSAQVRSVGGVAPFQYAWSNGSTRNIATGLSAGTHGVTITDFNECTATTTVTIMQANTVQASTINKVNVTCNGGANGSVTAVGSNGTTPYSYEWSNGSTSSTNNNLRAGTYTVTITDNQGCTATESVTITEPSPINATINVLQSLTCNGDNNASVEVNHSGGMMPFEYSWSNGATTKIATNFAAGNYQVTVSDGNNCTDVESVTIQAPPAVRPNASATNVSGPGASDGSATALPSGGTSPYAFSWNTGATQPTISNLSVGTYTVTVTDAEGCSATQSVTVSEADCAVSLSTSTTDATCNGSSTGTANVEVSGSNGELTYEWSNGATTATIQNLSAGMYTVTVTDANSCQATTSVTIGQPAVLIPSISERIHVKCNGDNTGSATVSATGGTAPYSYEWPTGGTAATEVQLYADQYVVTVTDANDCVSTIEVVINEPTAFSANIGSQTDVTCAGAASGSAIVSATGGVTPYTYAWSNSRSTASVNNLTAGMYTVTVGDANNCNTILEVEITQPDSLRPSVAARTSPSCHDASDGVVTLTTTGGTAPYSYNWPGGAMGASQTGLTAGTYLVTINDSNGCSRTTSVLLDAPDQLLANAAATPVSVTGATDGSATANPSGGTEPYTYAWSTGQTTQLINGLAEDSYTVTVTDANGCTAMQTVVVNDGTCTISVTAFGTNISCNGANDGEASASLISGTDISYEWSNGATTSTITGLAKGTYTVTVSDELGCEATASVIISEPAPLTANISDQTDIGCNGGATGTATVAVSGGTMPYAYNWSNGSTLSTVSGLAAGNYQVTVSDANDCSVQVEVTITENNALDVSLTRSTDVACNGGENGSATIFVSGGRAPYGYLWSTGGNASTENNLPAGTHTVTVTDDNNCTTTFDVTLEEPDVLSATATRDNNVLCNGESNGAATINPTGGTAPYTYLWSNAATTASVNTLAAGSYTITITDANDCTTSTDVLITEPQPLRANASATHESSDGANDGTTSVTPQGGTAPYTYEWNNGETTPVLQNLVPGNYTVTVTDGNACTTTETVTVLTFQCSMINTQISTTNAECAGESSGSASVSVSGGQAPYTYSWSNGASTAAINNLPKGTYTVTVSDGQGCNIVKTAIINAPPPLVAVLSSKTNADCANVANGSATVVASGGVSPYRYVWSNASTGSTVQNLASGNYTVAVTDNNGCMQNVNVNIGVRPDEEAPIARTRNLTVFLNAQGSAIITPTQLDNGSTDNCGVASIVASRTSFGCGDIGNNQIAFTVRDNSGNSSTVSTTVTVRDTMRPEIICPSDIVIEGCDAAQVITFPTPNVIDNCTNITPVLTEGLTSGSVFPIGKTTQTFLATDDSGNRTTCTFTVDLNILAVKIDKNDPDCFNFTDGTATATPTSGSAPFTYQWSTSQTDSMITGLAAGKYFITVTDGRNCSIVDSVELRQPPVLDIEVDTVIRPSSMNATNGRILVNIMGGVSPYTFEWTLNGNVIATVQNPTGLAAGTYRLRLTDDNGCTVLSDPIVVPISTNTRNFELENGLHIQPNPSFGYLQLVLELRQQRNVHLTLHDVTGRTLRTLATGRVHEQTFNFDLSAQESGLYFIRIQADDQVATRRIVLINE